MNPTTHQCILGVLFVMLLPAALGSRASAQCSTTHQENFDGPPPYNAVLEGEPWDGAPSTGGWQRLTDQTLPFPPHHGSGGYAVAQDVCGTTVSKLLKFPGPTTGLIEIPDGATATLHLWALHGTCFPGCPPGTFDSCRLAIRKFSTSDPAGPFVETLLLAFPAPTISNCGGPGSWAENLVIGLGAYIGSHVQIVVYHSTNTIDHLIIDDLLVEVTIWPSNYCSTSPNSVGPGSLISSTGSTSVSANDFGLVSTGNPPNKPGLFIMGPTATDVPFGNGRRCVAGTITRYGVVTTSSTGIATYTVDNSVPPALGKIVSGSTWKWQFWYRDPAAGGAFFNLSNGLSTTYCP